MQQTINRIVGLFFSGTQDAPALARALYEEFLFGEEDGARENFESCGTVIPNEQMEYDGDAADRLGGFVTSARLDALWDDAEPTEDERQEYRRRVIAQVKDGSADADVIPGYWVYPLRHTDGREVFALETVKGYSFSGVSNTFHGLFSSVEEALESLSSWGLVVKS
jgi:hypothetical protein